MKKPMRDPLSNLYIRQAFWQSEYPINVTDLEGKIVAVNSAYLKLYGFKDDDEVIGKNQRIIRSKRTSKAVYHEMWNAITRNKVWKGQLINQNLNGEELPVYLSIYPIFEDGKKLGYMGFTFDRSQQVELERQLLHSNRLAVLGVLGAGLAHELNNPLTSISLEAENLRDQYDEGKVNLDDSKKSVQTILQGVDRMQRVISHLLSYVRKGTDAMDEIIDLEDLVRDSLLFLDRQFQNRQIKIKLNIESGLLIKGSRTDLESVLHNLLTNSRDAFEENHINKKPRQIEINITQSEPLWLHVVYKDNAGGIPIDVIPMIFDPFFTTKRDGKGTGLGLSISNKIIKEHGGELRVESGKGETTFYIGLPVHTGPESNNDWIRDL